MGPLLAHLPTMAPIPHSLSAKGARVLLVVLCVASAGWFSTGCKKEESFEAERFLESLIT